jgi:hypothetical protein
VRWSRRDRLLRVGQWAGVDAAEQQERLRGLLQFLERVQGRAGARARHDRSWLLAAERRSCGRCVPRFLPVCRRRARSTEGAGAVRLTSRSWRSAAGAHRRGRGRQDTIRPPSRSSGCARRRSRVVERPGLRRAGRPPSTASPRPRVDRTHNKGQVVGSHGAQLLPVGVTRMFSPARIEMFPVEPCVNDWVKIERAAVTMPARSLSYPVVSTPFRAADGWRPPPAGRAHRSFRISAAARCVPPR